MSNEELSRRLVACKHFHWKGMSAVGRKGSPDAAHNLRSARRFRVEEPVRKLHGDWKDALPDLSDPATLGCLLALVREAWKHPMSFLYWNDGNWFFDPQDGGSFEPTDHPSGRTEAEALVAALEAAP